MGLYRSIVRPLMFTLPPEAAHHVTSMALGLPAPWALVAGARNLPDIPTDLAGISLANPVGLAAGFDKNCRELHVFGSLGFGYAVGGSVSRLPRAGNSKPRIARHAGQRALTNAMGIPNEGVESVATHLGQRPATCPRIVSLADEEIADVLFVHERLAGLVDAFELNVSSPNSPWRHDRSRNDVYLARVLAALAEQRREPLFVKLPPFRTPDERREVLALARIAVDAGAEGLTCANTRPVADVGLAKGRGGLSGPPLFEDTPRMIESLAKEFPGLALNACGGITAAADAQRCLDAGARTVQLYTALIYEGPRVVSSIVRELT